MLVVVAVLVVPFLTKEHRVAAAIPQPPPLFSVELVQVEPGERACLSPITLPEGGDVAELKIGTFGAPPIPFTLTLSGGGHSASREVRGGYADNATVSVPVTPPPSAVRGAA